MKGYEYMGIMVPETGNDQIQKIIDVLKVCYTEFEMHYKIPMISDIPVIGDLQRNITKLLHASWFMWDCPTGHEYSKPYLYFLSRARDFIKQTRFNFNEEATGELQPFNEDTTREFLQHFRTDLTRHVMDDYSGLMFQSAEMDLDPESHLYVQFLDYKLRIS